MEELTVIDLFCGAGGFSEGFRQQGFKIVQGIDVWKPASDTFGYNFDLECEPKDILNFAESIDSIEDLPDTDVIIGSPPCTSFSSSNKSGLADKTEGIQLVEIFLRIVAVKKYKSKSTLKAWFMENVVNAREHIKEKYTFRDLRLVEWSKKHGFKPSDVAIDITGNSKVLNSADFKVAQLRKRLFLGEIVKDGAFPEITADLEDGNYISVEQIFEKFPSPCGKKTKIQDPNFPQIQLTGNSLTDHFYDTGIYQCEWEQAKHTKKNHPYMGKMSFPENRNKPSRTVTATKLANSREALIYESELKRSGDGQYRTPTIRETAVLMSFPTTYQFLGSEGTKWRLIGNAVCPLVSAGIAKATLKHLNRTVKRLNVKKEVDIEGINNLNFKTNKKIFDNPPERKKGSRFRRHLFKDGNMTVALSNYCLEKNDKSDGKWRTTVTYGTGAGYKLQRVPASKQKEIGDFIEKKFHKGGSFVGEVQNGFSEKIVGAKELQEIYESNEMNAESHPIKLIEKAERLLLRYVGAEIISTQGIFEYKCKVHEKQIYALYVINQITKIANKKG